MVTRNNARKPIAQAAAIPSTGTMAGIFLLTGMLSGGAAAYVHARLVVYGDSAATALNILHHESLFAMASAANLASAACYVALTLLLHELFKPTSGRLSLFSAFTGLMSSAILVLASVFDVGALVVVRGAQYFHVLTVRPFPALALVCLNLRMQAYSSALAFFGVYCLLIGCLLLRSAVLPRITGVLMTVAGLSWLTFLSPVFSQHPSAYVIIAGVVGQAALIYSLILTGGRRETSQPAAADTPVVNRTPAMPAFTRSRPDRMGRISIPPYAREARPDRSVSSSSFNSRAT